MRKLLPYIMLLGLILGVSGCKPDISKLQPREQMAVEAVRTFNDKGGHFDGEKIIVGCSVKNPMGNNRVSFVYMPDYNNIFYNDDFYTEDEFKEIALSVSDKLNNINIDDYNNLNEYFDEISEEISDNQLSIYHIYSSVVARYKLGMDFYNSNITLIDYENIKKYV